MVVSIVIISFQCLEILEDHEESFLEHYMAEENPGQAESRICYAKARYCNDKGTGAFGADQEVVHDLDKTEL